MELSSNDWYVADSFKNLETIGGVFVKDDKEYINVVLKSGKVHAARVYRKVDKLITTKTNRIFYDQFTELGFSPKHFIYAVRLEDESKLQSYCHFSPYFGAYLKCTDDIFDLPLGCKIEKIHWVDVCNDDIIHLKSKEEVRKIVEDKFLWFEKIKK